MSIILHIKRIATVVDRLKERSKMTFKFKDKVVHAQRGLFEDRSGRVGTVITRHKQKPDCCVVEFDDGYEVVPDRELELIGGIDGSS